MHEVKTLDRRTFTLESALAILSGVVITISNNACGGGSTNPTPTPTPTPGPTPTPAAGDKPGAISSNHGHTVTITGAQLTAGGAVSLQLTTGSGHTHSLALSSGEVTSIAANQRVSHESSDDAGHTHTVTFN